jgi:large subunit ribosomal protein LP0
MAKAAGSYLPRKVNFMEKIDQLIREYSRVFIVAADNVGSRQMQQIRVALRGKATLLMGKNTMIRAALTKHAVTNPKLNTLKNLIVENIGLVFTHESIATVKTLITSNRVPAQAKVGGIAPEDVIIQPGPTGLDPGQTSFFQALNISTKLARGEIEIQNQYTVVKKGEAVNASVATLLQKLKITPFTYGLEIRCVYDDGTVFDLETLDITDEMLAASFLSGVANVAAVSLETKIPTLASLPHSIVNGYKNVLAVALETKYSFPGLEKVKSALAAPTAAAASSSSAAAAAPAPAKADAKGGKGDAKPKEEPKPKPKEPEPEPDDGEMDMGALFG